MRGESGHNSVPTVTDGQGGARTVKESSCLLRPNQVPRAAVLGDEEVAGILRYEEDIIEYGRAISSIPSEKSCEIGLTLLIRSQAERVLNPIARDLARPQKFPRGAVFRQEEIGIAEGVLLKLEVFEDRFGFKGSRKTRCQPGPQPRCSPFDPGSRRPGGPRLECPRRHILR